MVMIATLWVNLKQLVTDGNSLKIVEMRGVESRIVYSSVDTQEIEDLCDLIKFNAQVENSYDNLIADSIKWVRDKVVENDSGMKDKLAIVVTDGMFNKARTQAEVNLMSEAGLEAVCMLIDASNKINKVKSAVRGKDGKIAMKNQLDDFPFTNYTVVVHKEKLAEYMMDIVKK